MKKWMILGIILLVVIGVYYFLAGLNLYLSVQKPRIPEPEVGASTKTADDCEKVVDIEKKDYCFTIIAQETKNVNLCEKITDSEKGDDCYQKIAIETNDVSLCEKITGSGEKDYCYKRVASETRDVTLTVQEFDETANWNVYQDEKYGFEIKYPQDWTKKQAENNVGFAPPEKDSSLIVSVLDISTHPITLEEYKQYFVSQCKMPNCNIIDSSDTTLANNPAYKVIYSPEVSEHPSAAFMGIFAIKGNKIYVLGYESAEYSKYLDIVNAMIDSFEII